MVEDIDRWAQTDIKLKFSAEAQWDITELLESGIRLKDLGKNDLGYPALNVSIDGYSTTMSAVISSSLVSDAAQDKTFDMEFRLDVLPPRSMTRSFSEGSGTMRTEILSVDGANLDYTLVAVDLTWTFFINDAYVHGLIPHTCAG